MCQTHNTIIRGYNSIYRQAPAIVEGDRADFVGYCLTWHKFVMKHTENEDSSLFPRIEQLLSDESIFSESLKEHGNVAGLLGRLNVVTKRDTSRCIYVRTRQVWGISEGSGINKSLSGVRACGDHVGDAESLGATPEQ